MKPATRPASQTEPDISGADPAKAAATPVMGLLIGCVSGLFAGLLSGWLLARYVLADNPGLLSSIAVLGVVVAAAVVFAGRSAGRACIPAAALIALFVQLCTYYMRIVFGLTQISRMGTRLDSDLVWRIAVHGLLPSSMQFIIPAGALIAIAVAWYLTYFLKD